MAFDSLSEKLQNVFKNLRGKGRLTEADVKAALKEVKLALLEADVSFKVVKQFIKAVEERAVGTDVLESLTPGQTVIKIVHEEMIRLMGTAEEIRLKPSNEITVIMMTGLQGAGKTTTAAKLAGKFKIKGRKVLLAACDVYRPAAIKQLQVNGEKQGVEVFSMGDQHKPVNIAKAAVEHARSNGMSVVILDTAGRLHIDEDMMNELIEIKENVDVTETVLVVDSMTGQDAVNVAASFDEALGITGVVLTKLDGDTRGGAALSVRAVTGKPIKFVGTGEKLGDLDVFHPDRMASRILGMGDMLSLIEKAEQTLDRKRAEEMERNFRANKFDLNDLLDQLQQLRRMGSIKDTIAMIPGLGGKVKDSDIDEGAFDKMQVIIQSMTRKERERPDIINPQRKRRIAAGSGTKVEDVNRLLNQYRQMQKLFKQVNGKDTRRRMRRMMRGMQ